VIRRRRAVQNSQEGWNKYAKGIPAAVAGSSIARALLIPRGDVISRLLKMGPGKSYLDIGCNTAAYARLLATRADAPFPVTVDISRKASPDLLAWPERLPFSDGTFDCVTSLHLIRRLEDDVVEAFASELARVLAPQGNAIVLDFGPVKSRKLNCLHKYLLSTGSSEVELRGWGRLGALFAEKGFLSIELLELGPYVIPPIPRTAVLLRKR
jgi:SAM-dependent methyltransferase|tara:strand:- start:2114 stop:2746 length:633 start_codon:yes stop_codon:yes gene_type:complete